jgi:serine/threonine protein kinase
VNAQETLPDINVGPYELLRTIGKGNLGTVYLARDPQMDVEVALKVFDLDAVTNMPRETALRVLVADIHAAQKLIHDNITGVLAFGLAGEYPYLAMQRVFVSLLL